MSAFKHKTYRVEWLSQTGHVDQYGMNFKPDYEQAFATRDEAEADLKTRATYDERLSRWVTGKNYHEGQIDYRQVEIQAPEWLAFNLNSRVRIKLTDEGRAIWKNREDAAEQCLKVPRLPLPAEDAEGWSEWAAWEVFSVFGSSLYMGCIPPFELTIQLKAGEI